MGCGGMIPRLMAAGECWCQHRLSHCFLLPRTSKEHQKALYEVLCSRNGQRDAAVRAK